MIYASPNYVNRGLLWDHIRQLRGLCVGPWLLIRDFNEVVFSHEVTGGSFNAHRANILSQLLSDCSLLDIHTIGGHFTWSKNIQLGGHVRKRLDRCVVDVDWQLAFPDTMVEVLPQHGSDHNPLLLRCSKDGSRKSKLFHFQAA